METTAISSTQFMSVITALQEQISVGTIVEVLAVAAGVGVGMVFMWWGVRKLTKVLMSAFKKGKISL